MFLFIQFHKISYLLNIFSFSILFLIIFYWPSFLFRSWKFDKNRKIMNQLLSSIIRITWIPHHIILADNGQNKDRSHSRETCTKTSVRYERTWYRNPTLLIAINVNSINCSLLIWEQGLTMMQFWDYGTFKRNIKK